MDTYDLQARHAPVALTVLPLVLIAAVLVPEFSTSIALPTAFATAVVAAIYGLLARVARAWGRERQIALYKEWDGMPTTSMLRHRDKRLNPHTKARIHEGLRGMGLTYVIPSAEEEQADPATADARYESAMDEVRRRAKASKQRTVHRESISYGFARNLLGLKPLGIGIALVCLVGLGLSVWVRTQGNWPAVRSIDIASATALLLDLATWFFLVTPSMVRHQAEAYAVALFETIGGSVEQAADHRWDPRMT